MDAAERNMIDTRFTGAYEFPNVAMQAQFSCELRKNRTQKLFRNKVLTSGILRNNDLMITG
tara:strand:+ start:480 stop:662 length:183 start_codon:yes stop_codon:yes gene_type:complete